MKMRCPRCGVGALYNGVLTVVEICAECGLKLGEHDAADGPVFFVITFYGMFVTMLAGWVEYRYAPPLWLHAAIWAPLIILGSVLLLRVAKAMMIASEYRHHLLGDPHER